MISKYMPLLMCIIFFCFACKKKNDGLNGINYIPQNFSCYDAQFINGTDHIVLAGTRSNKATLICMNKISGELIWEKTTDTRFSVLTHCLELSDGILCAGYIITGNTDILLQKINNKGEIIWTKQLGGSATETPGGICIKPNGNIVLCGTTESYGAGDRDVILYELDATGNEIKMKTLGYSGREGASGILCYNQKLYMHAYSNAIGHGDRDLWLMALNDNLDTLWTTTVGTSEYEESGNIAISKLGIMWICGHSGTFPMHQGIIAALDTNGNVLHQNTMGEGEHDGLDYIHICTDHTIKACGYSSSFGNGEQAWIVRVKDDGSLISQENHGNTHNEQFNKILEDATHYYYIGYSSNGDALYYRCKK